MPADLATQAIARDPFKSDASGVDVDFQGTLEQFPSEERLEIDSPPARHSVDSSSTVSIVVDTLRGTEPFPAEPKLFIIVPAGPPVFDEWDGDDEQVRTRVAVDPPRRDGPSVIARAMTSISRMLNSMVMAPIRLARAVASAAWRGATMIGAACRAAASQVAMGTAGVLRRVKGLAFAGLRGITRTLSSIALAPIRLARAAMSAASRRATMIGAGCRAAVGQGAMGAAGVLRRVKQLAFAGLTSIASSTGVAARQARRGIVRTIRFPFELMRAAALAVGRLAASAATLLSAPAYGIKAAALIMAVVVATLVFVITPPKLPAVVRISEPPLEIPAKAPPAVEPIAEAPKEKVLAPSTTARDEQPARNSRPTPPPQPRPIDAAAIQRVLNRYRDAYSTLDVGAVRAIWPSVNVAALRTTFDRLAEHNVEYDSCKISAADAGAVAVCSGVAQSVQTGSRTPTTEHRQWRFVLSPVENRWLIETVAAR